MKNLFVIALSLVILTSGCSSNRVSKTIIDNPTTSNNTNNSSSTIMTANTAKIDFNETNNIFAFNIFKQIEQDTDNSENILISPLSIAYALSMTLNGAEGETLEAMLSTLSLNGYDKEEINSAFHALTKVLSNNDPDVDISMANSVWSRDDISINLEFISTLADYYNAEVKQFRAGDPDVPSNVNLWIEDKTEGMIKDMLDSVDPNLVMMLVNAICFNGKWMNDFNEEATTEEDFYTSEEQSSTAWMMHQTGDFNIYEGEDFNMAELPYGNGNYVIDILLPSKKTGINQLLTEFTTTAFNEWTSQMESRSTQLSLPRFKYEYKKELNEILSAMGMATAFGGKADFSGISGKANLAIDKVTHKAFIETTEEGTKAAAATVVGVKMMSLRPVEPFIFNVDHSFLFIIREKSSNTIVFMGKVVKP